MAPSKAHRFREAGPKKRRKTNKNKSADELLDSKSNPCRIRKKNKNRENPSHSNSKEINNHRNNNDTKPSSNFLDKMKARLSGGHFRMLNEKLYTCTGNEALNFFKEDPSLFNVCYMPDGDAGFIEVFLTTCQYHVGYQEQMSHWPELPVNVIMKWLKDHDPSLIVADFGCGDARLAKNVKNKVYSIDLVSSDPSVIACDMSRTPLESSSVDVAVFCLSLMGTDFPSYLQEAHRVLKPSGWLLIAEVKSRFDPNTGGADPNKFSKAICELGFTTVTKDFSNKMFILLYFKKKEKQLRDVKDVEWPELKPCLYKRR